jgi:hypothetical protein
MLKQLGAQLYTLREHCQTIPAIAATREVGVQWYLVELRLQA